LNQSQKDFLYACLNFFVWVFASFLAIFFRYDFSIPVNLQLTIFPAIFIIVVLYFSISYLDSKIFGKFQKNSIEEYFSILRNYISTGFVFFVFLNIYPGFLLPRSFPILASLLGLGFIIVLTRTFKHIFYMIAAKNKNILIGIYGAGQQSQSLIQKILSSQNLNWKPIVVFDDNIDLKYNKINGVRVVTGISLDKLLKKYNLQVLIITFSEISNEKLQTIQNLCTNFGVQLKIIPPIKSLTSSDFSISDLRIPTLEELIGKIAVKVDFPALFNYFFGKSILITGAGGSIGSEIARQISACDPRDIYLLDRDESGLLETEISLINRDVKCNIHIILADIRDRDRIFTIFSKIKPEIVFHAAALKHLNILQIHPEEGYKTNIEGTNNVLAAASNNVVKNFVNISTDKAADPISILGITKIITEQLTAGYAAFQNDSKFVSVRFGNVFGTKGSVLQTFSRQIELNMPITITDPRVERYFMTLEESVHLVLKAATLGESGDTLILQMGKPISIKTMAEKLIKMSGKKIEIRYSALRPGEKLSETLIGKNEKEFSTTSAGIIRLKVDPIKWHEVPERWNQLLSMSTTDQNLE